jgi:uncharacterized protein
MTHSSTDSVDAGGRPNRLARETSPYLQQHAFNPVDWYPWGPEAIDAAAKLDRPIFLSIGYSACHWCHVMEHESFEDPGIAELMNQHFVNVKVDREERPDLDQIYMSAVTALTGRGGWPLSAFLTPKLEPFYGGTYWPPDSRMGMPGFREVLRQIHAAWINRRDDVESGARELTDAIVEMSRANSPPQPLDVSLLEAGQTARLRAADRTHGGFGGAPKFPHPMDLRFLLRTAKRFGTSEALGVVKLTLDKMAAGGIYDHLGGGFHRYSTDSRWLVPHFEKMLYDNALLATAYLEAFQATHEPRYAEVVRETLDYVLREMTDAEGGFYSTQDADSDGEEGKFFVWSEEEVVSALGPERARSFSYCYDVTPQGNWEGQNILNRVKTHSQAARMLKLSEADLAATLAECRRQLFAVREKRVHPGRDDKILAGWNSLMISAMAQAGSVLGETRFTGAAVRAADFILSRLRRPDGQLVHTFKDGKARLSAYLDDYAPLLDALLDVYQATFETKYVDAALQLTQDMIDRFGDPEGGGFFYTPHDHEPLISRNKDLHDNATPSGNATAAGALLRLGELCGRAHMEDWAHRTLTLLSGEMVRVSMAAGQALIALDAFLGPAYELVIAEVAAGDESEQIGRAIQDRFLPAKVIARRPAGADDSSLPASVRPLLQGKQAIDGRATLYVCQRGTCQAPVTGLPAIQALLQNL